VPDLLGFNPKRELDFDPKRGVGFRPGRPPDFDPHRPLDFEPSRNLGFGRRGVVFRGFVCPICGTLTTETAKECAECGTVFDRGVSPAPGSPTPTPKPPAGPSKGRPGGPKSAPARRNAPASPTPAPAAPPTKSTFCTHCGARLWEGDAFCWNCGARTADAPPATTPPRRGR